jgi:hypothetical protein
MITVTTVTAAVETQLDVELVQVGGVIPSILARTLGGETETAL